MEQFFKYLSIASDVISVAGFFFVAKAYFMIKAHINVLTDNSITQSAKGTGNKQTVSK
jgi:hypothetical protein